MLCLDTFKPVPLVERMRAIPRDVRSHAQTATSNSLSPSLTSRHERCADSTAALAIRNDETENLCGFVAFKVRLQCNVHPSDDDLSIVGNKHRVIQFDR